MRLLDYMKRMVLDEKNRLIFIISYFFEVDYLFL